jgi:hypothetical protein
MIAGTEEWYITGCLNNEGGVQKDGEVSGWAWYANLN